MIGENLKSILNELPSGVRLVAVSKFHPAAEIMEAYNCGQRLFGENRPQEFAAKVKELPSDIEWHFIGHLQTNKLKLVLPYASIVESIDSLRLLNAVQAWAAAAGREVSVFLELHLGAEQTKGGLTEDEVLSIMCEYAGVSNPWPDVRIRGLMGMATNTDDEAVISADFSRIKAFWDRLAGMYPQLTDFKELSIGMSGDWRIAVSKGSTLIRVGTAIFGPRIY